MAFPKHFVDELRDRVNIVDLVGRRVALKKRGRDHWGCCPFHNEKTASFKISEDRADYHCFGCGAHGSAFDFVMQTEGLNFVEAVERLAEQAGVPVPQLAPEERQRAEMGERLTAANEAAAKWFQAQLRGGGGAAAREYIEGRGLSPEAVESFRLGYAPNRNDALKAALTARGFSEAELVEAGLLARPDDGRASYDRFRDRLIFPIGDVRGRVIAFGGRALGEARAKYLNSPETPLFNKSRTLYGHATAREAARDAGEVLVVEGYMDVIAVAEAGFHHVVAPLGTALTEDQIGLLWRMSAAPVICLDGDTAGLRAALRAAERALPILQPGKSLRFALLPQGRDPDDLIRAGGADAWRRVIGGAISLSEMIADAEMAKLDFDSPDARADCMHRLYAHADRIRDAEISRHYRQGFRDLFWRRRQAMRPAQWASQWGSMGVPMAGSRPGAPARRGPVPSATAIPPIDATSRRFHLDLVLGLFRDPGLCSRFRETLDAFEEVMDHPELGDVVRSLQAWADSNENTEALNDRNSVRDWLVRQEFGWLLPELEEPQPTSNGAAPDYRWWGSAASLANSALISLYQLSLDREYRSKLSDLKANLGDSDSDPDEVIRHFENERARAYRELQDLFPGSDAAGIDPYERKPTP